MVKRDTLDHTPRGGIAMASELMSTEDVAEHFEVTTRTIINWRKRGYGPRYALIGRRIRYRRQDVESWTTEQFSQVGEPPRAVAG
jgi:transposase